MFTVIFRTEPQAAEPFSIHSVRRPLSSLLMRGLPIFSLTLYLGKSHGGSKDVERMVGDLGNVLCDETGKCTVSISDSTVKLFGPHSVIGRSIVVYSSEDDGGRGGHENSLTTGNAGPRMAAGVVGLSA
jgi:Cu-Zn family superoxide dismutase